MPHLKPLLLTRSLKLACQIAAKSPTTPSADADGSGANPLPEECHIYVRAVDHRVAVGAGCQFRRTCIDAVHCASSDRAMALVAEHVYVRHIQQPRILRSMGGVASHASLTLYRGVLVNEWPALFCMALGANQVRVISGSQVALLKGAMHVVAIAALDEAFIHFVVSGHIKLRLDVGMALEAQSRLWCLEQ